MSSSTMWRQTNGKNQPGHANWFPPGQNFVSELQLSWFLDMQLCSFLLSCWFMLGVLPEKAAHDSSQHRSEAQQLPLSEKPGFELFWSHCSHSESRRKLRQLPSCWTCLGWSCFSEQREESFMFILSGDSWTTAWVLNFVLRLLIVGEESPDGKNQLKTSVGACHAHLSLVGWTPWEQLWAFLTAGSRSAVESEKFLLCTGTPSLFSMTSWSRWWMHTGMEFPWACWAVVSPPGRSCCSNFMCTFPYSRVKPAIFDLLLAVCIAAYLGVAYVAVQVRDTDVLFSL